jgi:hypothetical protein
VKQYFKEFVHNAIVHPLMMFIPRDWAHHMHDVNAQWAFGSNRFDEIGIEEGMKSLGGNNDNTPSTTHSITTGGRMNKDEILRIFHTFWPEEGYAGIAPHLPGWSKSRASNFACRHNIKMTVEGKKKVMQALAQNARNTRSNGHIVSGALEDTVENRFLTARW